MVVQGADTLLGVQVEVEADLVVLATGIEASTGASDLAEKLRISYDQYGFYMEGHPKLRPVETNTCRGLPRRCVPGAKRYSLFCSTGGRCSTPRCRRFSRATPSRLTRKWLWSTNESVLPAKSVSRSVRSAPSN